MTEPSTTDFGYERVSPQQKTQRVIGVFSSVASKYDLMNDLMSLGVHRLWKRQAVHISAVKKGDAVLDVAGGTGDMSRLYREAVGDTGKVIVCDLNNAMLNEGRDRLLNKGITHGLEYVQANAESLPFEKNSFDCIAIAFGLRNVTDKERALRSMYEKLKYGGHVLILEFSKVVLPVLKQIYDYYSFKCIPQIGDFVAKDKDSYRYLVESIRMHPDQETLKNMLETAGFSKVNYYNLSGGIVAIHKAYKI